MVYLIMGWGAGTFLSLSWSSSSSSSSSSSLSSPSSSSSSSASSTSSSSSSSSSSSIPSSWKSLGSNLRSSFFLSLSDSLANPLGSPSRVSATHQEGGTSYPSVGILKTEFLVLRTKICLCRNRNQIRIKNSYSDPTHCFLFVRKPSSES